jgi:hypothetical protein
MEGWKVIVSRFGTQAGPANAIDDLIAEYEAKGIEYRELEMDYWKAAGLPVKKAPKRRVTKKVTEDDS